MTSFKKNCVNPDLSILESLRRLKKTGDKCLLVVSKNFNLLGTLTDGDLRSAILNGASLKSSINKIYNKKPKFIELNQAEDLKLIKKILTRYSIDVLPVLEKKKIIKVIKWREFFSDTASDNTHSIDAVIMAGGKGTRLAPFTNILPKPLIPINNKPLISLILDNLNSVNIRNYWISVNYKWKILKSFLSTRENKLNLNYIKEKKPLGTAGSLSLLPKSKISDNFLLTNCDVLIDVDIQKLISFHKKEKSDLTLVVAKKVFKLPYGACKIRKDKYLQKIHEKPIYDYLANTGFYVVSKKILKYIKKDTLLDFNKLVDKLKKNKRKISCFIIEESNWSDFGVWENYYKEKKYFGFEKFK
tara:strand:- start:8569 stop:9642 length:1074 start_codon:yes stop_codon:yes gene_type:complete